MTSMEKIPPPPPPEKTDSFVARNQKHSKSDDDDVVVDNNNNNNNNVAAAVVSNDSETTAAAVVVDSGSSSSDAADVDSPKLECLETIGEIEERENVDESASSSAANLNITLPQASEEIDRFINSHHRTTTTTDDDDYDKDKSTPLEVPESVEIFVKLVESLIEKYDSSDLPMRFGQIPEDDTALVEALSRLYKLNNVIAGFPSGSSTTTTLALNKTSCVLYRAMLFLEEEFRSLLEDYRSSNNLDQKSQKTNKQSSFKSENHEGGSCHKVENETGGGEEHFPAYSAESVSNMNRIATTIISSGYETECCQVFCIARRSAFKEALNKLSFEVISIDDVLKMQWETLEGEIATWTNVVKQCATVFFTGERKFCDTVFSDYPSISRSLFSNLARAVVIQLLNFAEAIAMTKRAAEKLFKFLDMHETLRDLISAINGVCAEDSSHELQSEISAAASRLGEATVSIFCELENSIKSDNGKQPVPSGAVHPLTRYTMNYLKYACDEYKDTLEQVFQKYRQVERHDDSLESSESDSTRSNNHHNDHNQTAKPSPFAEQLMAVMDLLDINLDSKSKLYRDPSLRYIFLMNNGRYILQKIKSSPNIHEIVGDTWCRRRSSDLRQYHKNYQRETWGRLLGCLGHEGLQVNGKVYKPVLKDRFKSFNTMFDEIHRTQSTWVVCDEQLQSELRVSISAVVIPAYRSFLGRFSQYLDSGRQTEKYIKFQPEDIETLVDELFDGNPQSMARRRT